MKTAFSLAVLAVLLVAPGRCFALWFIAPVSTEKAKELGMEVRFPADSPSQPNQVRVELEFKSEGAFEEFSPKGKYKDRSRVELRFGEGDNPPLTAPLREDRSKPGRVVVRFDADPAVLDKISLWVMAPDSDGGSAYVLRVKDFVEREKSR